MKSLALFCQICKIALLMVGVSVVGFSRSQAQGMGKGKCGIYFIRMEPDGQDAKKYSDPAWGLGINASVPAPWLKHYLAGIVGIEGVNLLSSTTEFIDRKTGFRVEQQTDQIYTRLYFGPQVGGFGKGFFRPHAGVNLALVIYDISTDVVVPDDYNRENEIRQNLRSETRAVLGYDLNLGIDLKISRKVFVDGGVKYLKSVSVPQQLGDGSVTVHPQYFQIYLGAGVSLDMLFEKEPDSSE